VLFEREIHDGIKFMYPRASSGCEWVQAGEGLASIKYDGRPIMFAEGKALRRLVLSMVGGPPVVPLGWVPATAADSTLGLWPGWIPIDHDDPHFELVSYSEPRVRCGTFELIGPSVLGNPHRVSNHRFIRHGSEIVPAAPTSFDGLQDWLSQERLVEGLVWAHPDGTTAKIRRKDFGLEWPAGVPHYHRRRVSVNGTSS